MEVLEAAAMDGCGLLRTLRQIVIPMVLPDNSTEIIQ